jgi:hypothetical protein
LVEGLNAGEGNAEIAENAEIDDCCGAARGSSSPSSSSPPLSDTQRSVTRGGDGCVAPNPGRRRKHRPPGIFGITKDKENASFDLFG